ncbi:protein of unknown function [Xenorhabdus doucetiae]|uniref:Uncharacterized protein n=1 Tax=Xenorhabdus doucetiae TaxID=351671 RepID=A0A068QMM2_9GAMM|nr:protein of unknown function [Xenorhabdus doucetiae]
MGLLSTLTSDGGGDVFSPLLPMKIKSKKIATKTAISLIKRFFFTLCPQPGQTLADLLTDFPQDEQAVKRLSLCISSPIDNIAISDMKKS